MLMWNAACIVHDEFKGLELDLLKKEHPGAKVLVHPESPAERDRAGRRGGLDHADPQRRLEGWTPTPTSSPPTTA
jgi:hypothetical protein